MEDTTKIEVYKVISDISMKLREQDIQYILHLISQTPLTKMSGSEIELVNELAKRSRGDSANNAAELMWNIINSSE